MVTRTWRMEQLQNVILRLHNQRARVLCKCDMSLTISIRFVYVLGVQLALPTSEHVCEKKEYTIIPIIMLYSYAIKWQFQFCPLIIIVVALQTPPNDCPSLVIDRDRVNSNKQQQQTAWLRFKQIRIPRLCEFNRTIETGKDYVETVECFQIVYMVGNEN